MKKGFYYLFFIGVFAFSSCIKDLSIETGKNVLGKSEGTLKDSLGDCKGITVVGKYMVDSTINADSNYVLVNVTILKPGQYKIYSDTANGFWFWDSGYTAAGAQTIKVKAKGKPILNTNTNFQLNYNNSFCLFTVTLASNIPAPIFRDYFPTTIGSNWGYDVAGSADTLHIESSTVDTLIGGNTYHIFNGKQGLVTNKGYYYKDGAGNYYRYDALDVNSGRMSILFLKDNQPVLTQWDSPIATTVYQSLSTEVKMHFTILAKNVTRTINGTTYDSVIQVKNEMQYKILGSFQTVETINTYYAKNIGLIDFDAPGILTYSIRRYRVY